MLRGNDKNLIQMRGCNHFYWFNTSKNLFVHYPAKWQKSCGCHNIV